MNMRIPAAILLGLSSLATARDKELSQRVLDQIEQSNAPAAKFHSSVGTPRANVDLPEGIKAEEGKLTLYADFANRGVKGTPLYLINRTGAEKVFSSQDGDVYLKLEAQLADGRWVRVENHIPSDCGLSFMPVTLATGQHFQFFGYAPTEGVEAEVRYRNDEFVSNVGKGWFLERDRELAAVDQLAAQQIPETLQAALSEDRRHLPLEMTPQLYLFAVELVAAYEENGFYRRAAERYLKSLPAEEAEVAGKIDALVKMRWPHRGDKQALLARCVGSATADATGEIPWGVIGDLIERAAPKRKKEMAWNGLVRKAYAKLPAALDSEDEGLVAMAAPMLRLAEADEHLTSKRLSNWLKSPHPRLVEESAFSLSRRSDWKKLAEHAQDLPAKKRIVVLRALASNGARSPLQVRSPESDEEKAFWVRCAEELPVETVTAIMFMGRHSERTQFDRTIYPALRSFLEKQVQQMKKAPKALENEEQGYSVACVVRFVGGWQRRKDIPLFEALLKHPGYQKSHVHNNKTDLYTIFRRYRVREEAKAVLEAMDIDVRRDVVLKDHRQSETLD